MRPRIEDMETDNDKPIAREPWQRLLRERYDAPPEITDARIRAAARRALAPRPARWWLPASLAASVLLAVMLVQWQYGNDRAPAYVTESDVAAPMIPPPATDLDDASSAAASGAAASDERARESADKPAMNDRHSPVFAQPPAPPEYDAPPASARPPEAPAEAMMKTAPLRQAAPAARAEAEASHDLSSFGALKESAATPRDPDEWYATIEALRADGQVDEADAELARLEAAWPGWLEKHHPQNR